MIKVNGEEMQWRPGLTVKDILEAKRYIFPMIGVWINGKPIPRDKFETTIVNDGDDVKVIHMICGG
ncbi:sulfur carrier protein ThiS [Acetomicrobium sp.]|uniref:sulfur carrier protein ThiS n=1 Tax=Acetomicrobium sp. TaxID=1872099 RepID=UPI002FCB2EA2